MGYYLGVKSGAHYEFSSRSRRSVSLLRCQHSACAHQHIGEFLGHYPYAVFSRSRPERHLSTGKPAAAECLCERLGISSIVKCYDRHDAYI